MKRIVILGGGFGGVYTAIHLIKKFRRKKDVEIILINRENYFVYQPMLAEVVGGAIGILDTISSLSRLLKGCQVYVREIEWVDLEKKKISMMPKYTHKSSVIWFDHLVLALGNVTNFKGSSGLHEHAFPFKTLADALSLRNHIIETLETAAYQTDPVLKKALLTYVVGGGGFSGAEVIAEMNDLVRRLSKGYSTIDPKDIRVILVHSKDRLMDKEMPKSLSLYAEKLLKKRGVEILFGTKLVSATPRGAILNTGEKIESRTVVSTVPSSINPIIEQMDLPKVKSRIEADSSMRVKGQSSIWAIGDCAHIPDLNQEGASCPPTAQYAVRQGKVLAHNIYATFYEKEIKEFRFTCLGMLAALGHNSAIAELFGKIRISGFFAWLLWRALYWMKLPGLSRKLKVLFSWFLDMIVPIEAVQLKLAPSQGITSLHYEVGEEIFREGDIGDYLYILVKGSVEVLKGEKKQRIAELREGEFFGEMSLLNERSRTATVRCKTPVDVLAIRKADFGILLANFSEMKEKIRSTEAERIRKSR
ncbi:MAG: FAD-dependent oxidoreductase [Chlamydiota bacterium]